MKKCFECGNENPDQMAFCLQCGKPVSQTTASGLGEEDPSTVVLSGGPPTVAGKSVETRFYRPGLTMDTTAGAAPPPKKSRTGLVIGLVVAALGIVVLGVAALVGGYFYFTRDTAVVTNTNGTPRNTNSSGNSNSSNNTNTAASPTPTPVTSFTPPTEATKTGSFTVDARSGWQLSDIDTIPLEEFKTTATGLIDLGGLKSGVGPKGITDAASKSRRLVPDFPTGALLMRTHYADGKFSNVQAVLGGKSNGNWQNFKDERGKVEFCINDNAPQNNGGQFTVTVKMTKVPKTKN